MRQEALKEINKILVTFEGTWRLTQVDYNIYLR